MIGHGGVLGVLAGWSLAAALILALLAGALTKPGYLQVTALVVMEALFLIWVFSIGRVL